MKANNKTILNEYKARLRKIINMHPFDSIRFNQFMELLTVNCIRSYSKAQISKIYKFFENPLKLCRIELPLSFLELLCVQEYDKYKYFVVRVSATSVNLGLYDVKEKPHNATRCLQTFTKILRRHYGNQKNWFKVLGGLTVSVTIDQQTFERSVAKVLQNTSHSTCTKKLVSIFSEQSNNHKIQWKSFMRVINNGTFLMGQSNQNKIFRSSFLTESVESTDFFKTTYAQKERSFSLPSSQNKQIKYPAYVTIIPKRKKSTATSINQPKQVDFSKLFSVSAKQCVLYRKRSIKEEAPSTMVTNNKITHRRLKTQSNFFDVNRYQKKQPQIQTEKMQIKQIPNSKTKTKSEKNIIQSVGV